jgi:hypothetical protein
MTWQPEQIRFFLLRLTLSCRTFIILIHNYNSIPQGDELHKKNVCHVIIIWSGWRTFFTPKKDQIRISFALDPTEKEKEKNKFLFFYALFNK